MKRRFSAHDFKMDTEERIYTQEEEESFSESYPGETPEDTR